MEIHSKNSTIQNNEIQCLVYSHTSKHNSLFKENTTINLNNTNLDFNYKLTHSKCHNDTVPNLYLDNMNQLSDQIINPQLRKTAIIDICKSIDDNKLDIGYFIYSRPGIIAALLLEIVQHYPTDKSISLSSESFEIICSIIAIFQQIILNNKFRSDFISTNLLTYLLPYFNIENQTDETEHLRISLLSLYVTVTSKLSINEIENFLLPELNIHFNNETINEKRLEIINKEMNLNSIHNTYSSLNDLFKQTLKALIQCHTEIGKTIALILLERLLNCSKQRIRLYYDYHLFNELILCLTQIIQYMVKKFTIEIQQQFKHKIYLYKQYDKIIFIKAKRLLQFTLECFNQLMIDLKLRNRLRHSLPIELRSNLFSVILLHDQDVQLWLEKIWSQLGWNKMN
ncbi:unnamed protein product [Schistosoma margrebowiei]|uniref:CCR4-NOT transcription complex subunit 9 n=1 Tax=Schistosoma margrebowiei TaxID=48269 RepID=A0A183MIP1_9TREM|nr:unnamed protein product [Schistosoma margrebowiei]VDP19476.1 unnamed protein product [Schistosoma margrebowiei]